jgi:hypothetical protein
MARRISLSPVLVEILLGLGQKAQTAMADSL